MDFRETLRRHLRRDEDVRESAYQDSEGYWTIGVGRLIDARLGGKLRPDEIALMLENDIDEAEKTARFLVPEFERLSPLRRAVLCNMAHNLGMNRLSGFARMLDAVNEGRWKDAAAEMLDSLWAKQVGKRALRLAFAMEHDQEMP